MFNKVSDLLDMNLIDKNQFKANSEVFEPNTELNTMIKTFTSQA